jgi:hypothetical protein
MLQEKNLLVYWVSTHDNVISVLVKLESDFGASVPSHPWVTK